MSGFLSRLLGARRPRAPRLKLRATRFAQLIGGRGALLDLAADAEEKQAGDFVFDRQYLRSMAETAAALAEAVVFDLNVISGENHLELYESLARVDAAARRLLDNPLPAADPSALPRALFLQAGRVAARGFASGPVVNLTAPDRPDELPDGSVLVASDLGFDDAGATLLPRAAALLLDRGSPAGDAAALARRHRLPCLVGLGDATTRLLSGQVVTVDGETNAVWEGRTELALVADPDTDDEYRMLRALRRALFAATFGLNTRQASAETCRTVRDVVELAQVAAGDAVAALATELRGEEPGLRIQPLVTEGTDSRPLAPLLAGLGPAASASRAVALTWDERMILALPHPGGTDLVLAVASPSRRANRLFCRLAPRSGERDAAARRGQLAAEVLNRLEMSPSSTGQDVSGWAARLTGERVEARLEQLGRVMRALVTDPGLFEEDPATASRALLQRSGEEAGWQRVR